MADIQGLARGILDLAGKVAPLIVPAAAPAIAVGRSLIGLIDKAKSVAFDTSLEHELDAARDEIEARINAKADATEKRLAGDD